MMTEQQIREMIVEILFEVDVNQATESRVNDLAKIVKRHMQQDAPPTPKICLPETDYFYKLAMQRSQELACNPEAGC